MAGRKITFFALIALLIAAGCSDDEDPTTPKPPTGPFSEVLDAVKDNTLYEDSAGAFSNGGGQYIFAGTTDPLGGGEPSERRRAVIAFDADDGGIPMGATIDSVFLMLAMNKTKLLTARQITIHRLTKDWGEGTTSPPNLNEGQGEPADSGDATWIHTHYDTASWSTPGGDFVATSSASQTVAGPGTYIWGSTPQMVADVQMWLDDPSTDFGWIIIGDETTDTTAKRFGSRENNSILQQPEIVVYYTP